jgi:hypothetical protein
MIFLGGLLLSMELVEMASIHAGISNFVLTFLVGILTKAYQL